MACPSTARPLAASSDTRGTSYERHRPEQTILYKTLQAHWRTFLAEIGDHESGSTLPRFVIEEIEAFLKCGILANGFVRVSCDGCGADRVVALSCKRRGFCPSCVGRRMCDFAAHFVDNVAPHVPIRQWVLSVPHGLRFRMAFDPRTTSLVLRIFVRAVSAWMRRRARMLRIKGRLETGGVTAIQRFGSAANLNLHFHTLMIDGVYQPAPSGSPVFHPVPPPDERDVAQIAATVWRKATQKLARLDGKQGVDGTDGIARDEPLLAALASASVAGLIATGHRRGARVLRIGRGPSAASAALTGKQCATVEGFNVHAAVRVGANDRQGLERLARYLSRPPIANNRLEQLPDGRLALRLKRAFRDGTEVIIFTPGELIEKLVLLVPRPRKHLTIFHGVLAPASRLRPLIVPASSTNASTETTKDRTPRPARHLWADLLRRVWAVDVLKCGRCGGRMRIIAALMDAPSAARLLRHLGLPAAAPVTAAPRGPPQTRLAGGTPANDSWADPPAHEDIPA